MENLLACVIMVPPKKAVEAMRILVVEDERLLCDAIAEDL